MLAGPFALLFSTAYAGEPVLWAPKGAPIVGQRSDLEVMFPEDPGVLPRLSIERGTLEGALQNLGNGHYRLHYLAPAQAGPEHFQLSLGGESWTQTIEIRPLKPSSPSPSIEDAILGQGNVTVFFPFDRPPALDEMQVRSSEGKVIAIHPTPNGVAVEIRPDESHQARILSIGLLDLRQPEGTPVFALVRLRVQQQATLQAEAGSRVSLKVGGHNFGPVIADEEGKAQISFELGPGVTAYEVWVEDDLGNSQRVRSAVPGPFLPTLLLMEAPRPEGGADLWLGAWNASGNPWTGNTPSCRSAGGDNRNSMMLGRALYRYNVAITENNELRPDIRVECELEGVSQLLRVPAGASGPTRIELRAYPTVLSSDFPVADVQASLMDRMGERLNLEGMTLSSQSGQLTIDPMRDGILRAEYQGQNAINTGTDMLYATWSPPPGHGQPWRIQAWAEAEKEAIRLRVYVIDRLGSPLSGIPILIDGQEKGVSGEGGWAEIDLPNVNKTQLLHLQAGQAVADIMATTEPLPPMGPRLQASLPLTIAAGRVRRISLEVEPQHLELMPGMQATVHISLYDGNGVAVPGETVQLHASEGQISQPIPVAEGAWEAVFEPDSSLNPRRVQIEASAGNAVGSTDLTLIARPVRGSLSLSGGWMTNFGLVSSPLLWMSLEGRLPHIPELFQWRVGLGTYAIESAVKHIDTQETIDISARFIPIELGGMLAYYQGGWEIQGGLSGVLVPWHLDLGYGDIPGPNGFALAPGMLVQAGGGIRRGPTALVVELRYLLFTASGGGLSFEGSPGGLGLTAGYRILY